MFRVGGSCILSMSLLRQQLIFIFCVRREMGPAVSLLARHHLFKASANRGLSTDSGRTKTYQTVQTGLALSQTIRNRRPTILNFLRPES